MNDSDKNKHIFQKNKTYYTISIYTVFTIAISAIFVKLIWNWASTSRQIGQFFSMLSPFLIGFFIAYLLNPLIIFIDKTLFKKLCHIKKPGIRKVLSIILIYVLVFGVIALCIIVIIPELYTSISNIYLSIQDYYNNLVEFLEKMNKKYPDVDLSYVSSIIDKNSQNIVSFIQGSIGTILPILYNTSISVISWTINMIIAIIVSCYMLIDKKIMTINVKKIVYAILKKDRAEYFIKTVNECNKIFSNFIIGKTIDSTIIGLLCFIFMNILGLKYSLLVSVIVGITNMIPYFGPFIGAVPGVILCLTISWKHALIFCILIFVLQQFDGLYLGPKILGSSTGLRPVWIIFAITTGGWIAGVIGMFLGVPVVAVISFLIDRLINHRLKKINISPEDFIVINTAAAIQEYTPEEVKMKVEDIEEKQED